MMAFARAALEGGMLGMMAFKRAALEAGMLGLMAFVRAVLEGGMLGMMAVGMYILTSDIVTPSIASCSTQMGVKNFESVQYTHASQKF